MSDVPEKIECPLCGQDAEYKGTQDKLAVYVCPNQHLTRVLRQ